MVGLRMTGRFARKAKTDPDSPGSEGRQQRQLILLAGKTSLWLPQQ
jgi:hypothetical protein